MRISLLLLLLLTTFTPAQEVSPLRKRQPQDAVNAAKELVKLSEESPIIIPLGGYALIPMEVQGDAFIVPGSDNCLAMEFMPQGSKDPLKPVAGSTYAGWLVKKSNPGVFVFTNIPANPDFPQVRVHGITPGKQTIVWHGIVEGKSTIINAKAFQVGDVTPTPPKPPGPVPPEPPNPIDPPIPGVGYRVLIVTESKDLSTLPSAQRNAIHAKEVADYLNSHCVKEGNQPEWRILDQNTVFTNESTVWKAAMDRALGKDPKKPEAKATSLPWIIVTDGKSGGYEGPLPTDKDALMTLLKKYGGN